MNRLIGVVNSVQKVGDRPDVDECLLTINTFDTYTIFGDYNDLIGYIGKEVEFTVRLDVVRNFAVQVINWVAERKVVQYVEQENQQLEYETTSSLIPANNKNAVIDFDSTTLKMNDIVKSKVILVSHYTKGKSKIARWVDFTCLDCFSRAFQLRLFTNEDHVDEFSETVKGKYIMADIQNTIYGLQACGEMSLYDQEVLTSPEVYLAALKCSMVLNKDPLLAEYVSKFDMVETLKSIVYYEPGFHLVELASELTLLDSVCSINRAYDKELLRRAIFCSRGYLIPASKSVSNPIANYHRVIISPLKDDIKLISLLDVNAGIDDGDMNKVMFYEIRRMVTTIIKERRGANAKGDVNVALDAIDNIYGGVFRKQYY